MEFHFIDNLLSCLPVINLLRSTSWFVRALKTQTENTSLESCLSSDFMPWSFTLQHKSYCKHNTNFVYKWTHLLPEFITSYLVTSLPPLISITLVIREGFRRLLQRACVCCRHSCFPRTETRAALSPQTPQHREMDYCFPLRSLVKSHVSKWQIPQRDCICYRLI